jgi:hypothetical protein
MDCRLLVVSCPARKSLQQIWEKCFLAAWPDCELPVTILSPENDVGWNVNLITQLEQLELVEFILLMLDDNFLEPSTEYTDNINRVLQTMRDNPDIGMIKLQAGGAHAPEIIFKDWDRIREYDRNPHPFKRTNLVPCMYRREWLLRLSRSVRAICGPEQDKRRQGAIEFEMEGTKLTEDRRQWPERMLGIHRPEPDGSGGHSLLVCYANDAVTGGKIRPFLRHLCDGVEGAEVYL